MTRHLVSNEKIQRHCILSFIYSIYYPRNSDKMFKRFRRNCIVRITILGYKIVCLKSNVFIIIKHILNLLMPYTGSFVFVSDSKYAMQEFESIRKMHRWIHLHMCDADQLKICLLAALFYAEYYYIVIHFHLL